LQELWIVDDKQRFPGKYRCLSRVGGPCDFGKGPLKVYIVQLEMEMVKLNKMRTFRRYPISTGMRFSSVPVLEGSRFFGAGGHFQTQSANSLAWLTAATIACVLAVFAQPTFAADTNTTAGYLEVEFQKWHAQFQANTNSAEAAWNFGRACFDMSSLQKDSSAEARYAQEGIDATRTALELDPSSAPAHYYLGMDLGQLADTKRNLSAFRMVKDMEREFAASRALDKHFDYAGPSRNLGLLYRDAPAIVSIGSRTKARQYLEEAVQLAPEFPENQLNLIESYLKWDYKTEALRQYGELEKMWPQAQKHFTGVAWQASWTDWNKRLDVIRRKLEKNPKNESPHSQ
jgi:tetratricopeptide (TPR) repeat protein